MLDNTRWGDAIAARVLALAIADTAPITTGQLQTLWRAIKDEDILEWAANGTITLLAGDILVPASATFKDSVGLPCTGSTTSGPSAFTGRIS